MIGNRTMFDHEDWTSTANSQSLSLTFNEHANVIVCKGNHTGKIVYLPPGDTKNAYGECYIVNDSGQSITVSHDTAATGNVQNVITNTDYTLDNNEVAFCKYVPFLWNYGKKVNGISRGQWIVYIGGVT